MTTLPAPAPATTPQAAPSRSAERRASSGPSRSGLPYVIPTWVFMLAVGVVPIGYAVWMSVTDQALGGDGSFVGLQNYTRSVFTQDFLSSLAITVGFTIVGLLLQFVVGYLLAVALHRQLPGFKIARTVLLVPMLLTPVVVGLVWQFMFNPDLGIITSLSRGLGVELNVFGNATLARALIVVLDAWMFVPFVMLMLVAGMAGVPEEPLEAAALDGASWWQTNRYVVLPILQPVITVTLIVRCLDIVRLFDTVFTTTHGGPGTSTQTVSMFSYQTTFEFYQFGQGAAMSVALAAVMFPVYFLYVRMTKI